MIHNRDILQGRIKVGDFAWLSSHFRYTTGAGNTKTPVIFQGLQPAEFTPRFFVSFRKKNGRVKTEELCTCVNDYALCRDEEMRAIVPMTPLEQLMAGLEFEDADDNRRRRRKLIQTTLVIIALITLFLYVIL